ncbi:hypothetical protein KEJ27_03870 [Candidatus Bathyarchaeota archaeon]|nr:hypothetical protein [Candidatus Bathyarchaeota archaeon]MBS7612689.1 hypothetical protein [Candidatus Bathyarchaeota archaeon]MBS7618197.1 hypothetical protein [Candidatus Bathyarchaeota archaeon]
MNGYTVVAAKVPKKIKELMDTLGIKPGPVIRRALEEEVKRVLLEKLESDAKRLSLKLKDISDEEIAELIREDRER